MPATLAENKEFIAQYIDALSGKPKPEATLRQFVSDRSLLQHIAMSEAAFPKYVIDVHQVVAEGEFVALRGTFRGEHLGTFFGVPATGRKVSAPMMIFYRIVDRSIVDHSMLFDAATVMAQLTADA